jgi:PRC-barrel domain
MNKIIQFPACRAIVWRQMLLLASAFVAAASVLAIPVDDLIVTITDRVLFAVISVGGFLGISGRLVAVPYSTLTADEEAGNVTLPGVTKDALTKLPGLH